jgi:hypothetical protein
MSAESRPALWSVITAAHAQFGDLDFVAPAGILELTGPFSAVTQLRIELPTGRRLQLQSIGLTTEPDVDVARLTTARTSSLSGSESEADGDPIDVARLLDFDVPDGPVFCTGDDDPAWLELSFSEPLHISAIRLRNVTGQASVSVREITLTVTSAGSDSSVVYNGVDRAAQVRECLAALAADPQYADASDEVLPLLPATGHILIGDYRAARIALEKAAPTEPDFERYKSVINETVLSGRSREWTIHGAKRSFRFWSQQEKVEYVELAAKLAAELKGLTPKVCFGFGAALAAVRDGDLIPHDDDLDLIIGFEERTAASLSKGLRRVERFLGNRGWTVTGRHTAHRQVQLDGSNPVDVFVGVFEGDTISWYPGLRGSLDRRTMYPTSEGTLLGVTCPLPRNPLIYLERVYGPGWRNPDPTFKHAWDYASYVDLIDRTVEPAAEPDGGPVSTEPGGAPRTQSTGLPTRLRRKVRRQVRRLVPAHDTRTV